MGKLKDLILTVQELNEQGVNITVEDVLNGDVELEQITGGETQ